MHPESVTCPGDAATMGESRYMSPQRSRTLRNRQFHDFPWEGGTVGGVIRTRDTTFERKIISFLSKSFHVGAKFDLGVVDTRVLGGGEVTFQVSSINFQGGAVTISGGPMPPLAPWIRLRSAIHETTSCQLLKRDFPSAVSGRHLISHSLEIAPNPNGTPLHPTIPPPPIVTPGSVHA